MEGLGTQVHKTTFGQVVVGPPGAGKTTYCHGVYQFCQALERDVAIVNLDPANENVPYPVAVDCRDLVDLAEVRSPLPPSTHPLPVRTQRRHPADEDTHICTTTREISYFTLWLRSAALLRHSQSMQLLLHLLRQRGRRLALLPSSSRNREIPLPLVRVNIPV
eukprot:COSAG05_NODE_2754_length_2682_cov_1.552846_2_plen_163_part_00